MGSLLPTMGRRSSSTQTSIRIASPSPQTYERGPREGWGEGVCDAPHWGFCKREAEGAWTRDSGRAQSNVHTHQPRLRWQQQQQGGPSMYVSFGIGCVGCGSISPTAEV